MHNMKRRHDAAFKARVGLEAMKEEKTTAQIASEYSVHPNQIRQWKKQILEFLPAVFSDRGPRKEKQQEELAEGWGRCQAEGWGRCQVFKLRLAGSRLDGG